MMSIYNRTLPMPRRRKTVVIPTRRPREATTIWPPAAVADRPEADRPGADSLHRKHASAGSGTALASMSIEAPNKAPQKAPVPLTPYQTTLALLRGRFPAIFGAARPLKVGIHKDLYEALGQEISKKDLRAFLGAWTHRKAYIRALVAGTRRIDLDGNDAGAAWQHQPPAGDVGSHPLDQADPEHRRGSMIELEKTA